MSVTPHPVRRSGRRAPGPSQLRSVVCTGPTYSKRPRKTNPMTYAGSASGSTSAHSNTRRPGNSHVTTSHARVVPRRRTPRPTPATKPTVFRSRSGSCVCQRCAQTVQAGRVSDQSTVRIGRETTVAADSAARDQGHERRGRGTVRAAAPATRAIGWLVPVPDAVRELRCCRLELPGGGDVYVVHLEAAPLDEERLRRHLGVGGVLEARLRPDCLGVGRGQELEEPDGFGAVL